MAVSQKLQRRILEDFLINRRYPRKLRRAALRAGMRSRFMSKWMEKTPKESIPVQRSWRASPDNEPSEKRIKAWRRKFPKPFPFYKEDMFDRVYGYLTRDVEFVDGRWADHWGDAAFYGIATDTLTYRMTRDPCAFDRALLSKRANLADIRAARENPHRMIENGELSLMAAMGLLLAYEAMPDWEIVPDTVSLVRDFTELLELFGGYIDVKLPMAFADYYGRSTPSAMFFMINLFLAEFYKRHDHPLRSQKAVGAAYRLLDTLRRNAFDPDGPRYLFAPDEKRAFCYPNPIMILGLTLLHELTGDRTPLIEAEGIFGWLQNLRDDRYGGYWTPYVNIMRNQSYDTRTKSLSAQNYIIYACLYLYRITRNKWYLEEMKSVIDFIERDMYYDGIIWHRITGGERSTIESKEPYCVGCNMMTLYLLLQINYVNRLGDKLIEMDKREKSRKKPRLVSVGGGEGI